MYKTVDGRIELKEVGPRFELFRMCFVSSFYAVFSFVLYSDE